MKRFNKTITVEVEVDQIAQQLLSTMAPDFKHRELLTETIVGVMLNTGKFSYVYNALNGYTNEIDFEVGEMVDCTEQHYDYVPTNTTDSDGNPQYEQKRMPMGPVLIKDIDIYRDNKLLVGRRFTNSRGEVKSDTQWVSHLKCNKFASNNVGVVAYPTGVAH